MATRGKKVCLFDADTGLANVNILLGIKPSYTIEHLLAGEKNIKDILMPGPRGIQIVPAASGIAEFSQLSKKQRRLLINNIRALEKFFDYLIIDTAAGIDNTVQQFVHAAHASIMVISQEPTSLTDAFALLRVLKSKRDPGPVYALINRVDNYEQSADIYKRFAAAVRKYLQITTKYLGYIADDPEVRRSIINQKPIIINKPAAQASRCFYTLANGIERNFLKLTELSSFSEFWLAQEQQANEQSLAQKTASQDSAKPLQRSLPLTDDHQPQWQDIISLVNQLIMTSDIEQNVMAESFETLIDSFDKKFGELPFNPEKRLLQQMQAQSYPKQKMREIAQQLEVAYLEHHQQPIRNSMDEIIHFLSNNTGDDAREQFQQLAKLLARTYHRRYNASLLDEVSSSAVQSTRPRKYPTGKPSARKRITLSDQI